MYNLSLKNKIKKSAFLLSFLLNIVESTSGSHQVGRVNYSALLLEKIFISNGPTFRDENAMMADISLNVLYFLLVEKDMNERLSNIFTFTMIKNHFFLELFHFYC